MSIVASVHVVKQPNGVSWQSEKRRGSLNATHFGGIKHVFPSSMFHENQQLVFGYREV